MILTTYIFLYELNLPFILSLLYCSISFSISYILFLSNCLPLASFMRKCFIAPLSWTVPGCTIISATSVQATHVTIERLEVLILGNTRYMKDYYKSKEKLFQYVSRNNYFQHVLIYMYNTGQCYYYIKY